MHAPRNLQGRQTKFPGVKYGVDFVAYRHHPALVHSEYAVIVLSEEHSDGNKLLTDWLEIHCTTCLCGGVAKTLLVLYISRNGQSVDSPSSVERFTVEERTIKRWKPEQCCVDDRLVQSEKGTELEQLGADIFSCCIHSTASEPLDIDDSEQMLNDDELFFNTMAEDGSDEEVAEKLTIMNEECLDEEYTNDYDEEEEENHYASRAISKMQPRRSSVSKAYWDDEMGMAVIFPKGRIWRTMGISRNGKLYISIEEVFNGDRASNTNAVESIGKEKERFDLQKALLAALFNAPERPKEPELERPQEPELPKKGIVKIKQESLGDQAWTTKLYFLFIMQNLGNLKAS